MRIVSLVPSVTETLLAWEVVPIAVTRFCERPELPAVGGTKNPDVAAIADLHPDLVVMNDARFISAYRTKLQSKLPS